MIRATAITTVDQALISALNFGLALVLIHYASKQEYGLYAQLLNLQPFFSPFHAGLFASSYLALASRMQTARRRVYSAGMAHAEITFTTLAAAAMIFICFLGSRILSSPLSLTSCAALGIATLTLWWREFARQIGFAARQYHQALRIDATYFLATAAAIGGAIAITRLSAAAVFWCTAFGGVVATAEPLFRALRGARISATGVRRDIAASWAVGKWETLASIVTWGYAQSYVYFAALHGGLDAAAEISASRLLATPLALMWAAYANVLRPSASRLLANGSNLESYRLAIRSALFVIGTSAVYSLCILALLPVLERTLFGGHFQHLRSLVIGWVVYTTLTGLTTVAASMLRSALEFRQVFIRHLISCAVAIGLITASLYLHAIAAIVIALCATEAVSALLFWHTMRANILGSQKTATPNI